ncbi:MAG: dTMP kinase [Nitrososphaerota archaeon]|nr:dTMP kinase [Candidatus Bathyarchaeota archaeon]MDW8049015.1 dTMP kinase [Nitrososphaerota archaeon]
MKKEVFYVVRRIKEVVKKGFFICIEGIDKSGKTTQSRLLVDALRREGIEAYYTTEPSEGEIGRFIRRQILYTTHRAPAVVEALLFAADRADHIEREILPAISKGSTIICDRYVYSSIAYQGAAGLSIEWIKEINRFALKPDLAIYLDVPVEVALGRCGVKKSIMESRETQERVREIYLRFVDSGEMTLIDASGSVKEVADRVKGLVLQKMRDYADRI